MRPGTAPRKGMYVAAVLSCGVLVASGVGYATADHYVGKVEHVNVFTGLTGRPASGGGTNVLVVGTDDRAGLTRKQQKQLKTGHIDYGRHTDTMMIVHLGDDGSASVVSIPRDSYVDIPDFTDEKGVSHPASKQKINAAYDIGGPPLAVETIEQATDVRIDHYAELNFAGFVHMVDALGGIKVCTPVAISDSKSGLELPAGESQLDGAQALSYVRARSFDPTADIGRMKRQQQFVASMFQKATSLGTLVNPLKLNAFLDAALSSVRADETMNTGTVLNLAQKAGGTSPSDVTFQTIPILGDKVIPGVGNVVEWDPEKSQELFAKLRSGGSITGTPKSKGTEVEVTPANIRVQVWNGTTKSGLATRAADDLESAGYYVVGEPRNAAQSTDVTVIKYDPGYDVSLETLRAAFPDAEFEEVSGLGKTFQIILGPDYNGIQPVRAKSEASPSASADTPHTAADRIC